MAAHYGRYGGRGSYSSYGFSLSGGYAANPSGIAELSIDKGYTAGLEMNYQYCQGRFLVMTGVGFRWQDARERFRDILTWDEPKVDTQGGDYTLRYSILRYDRQRMGQVTIPLLFGEQVGSFYFLVGPKLHINLLGNTRQDICITTTAIYDQYFSPLHDMADHGLRTAVWEHYNSPALPHRWDVRFSVEAGIDLSDAFRFASGTARLGVFAEGGVLPERVPASAELPLINTTTFDYSEWVCHHVMHSQMANEKWIGSLNVGLKLTLLFDNYNTPSSRSNGKYGCVICREHQIPRKKHHKCVICEYMY